MKKFSPNETKGALFAKKMDESTFEIEEVYFEPNVGSFAFVKLYNNRAYKKFCKKYFDKHVGEYHIHNYIGDWHSHPCFSCYPSIYDKEEVLEDLKKSNAEFLIQIIVKDHKGKLVGNAFYYDRIVCAKKIDLVLE